MTTETLATLGDALEHATAADLERTPKRRRHRRIALAAVVAAIAIPGLAIGADQLITTNEVAASMPAGTLSLEGTEPSCTVVQANVEFHCVLSKAPAPEVSDFKGTVEPTVDATKHVNGGCRSLTSDGREWECYIGQAAVAQQIVGAGFLGQYAPSPGVG
ncbi:MAG TPA: hypothetical protein VH063_10620 [Gaiellaceae bacterium]|jgi:hypothetical protein|nr:hypothetical protein [Gaiellaceae bacterium]